MPPSRLARSPLRAGLRSLLAAGLLTAVAVGAGVLTRGDPEQPAPPPPRETPFTTTALAGYDTSTAIVTRGAFCDAVDDRQVAAAVGGDPVDQASWANGDTIDLGNGAKDRAHEFGCRYTGADGTVAQAWVFAPQVAADQAQRLVKGAGKGPGCQAGAGPPFGSPSLALTCTAEDGSARASYRGLFGDAWLVCEVDRPAGATWDVADRAGRWCVGVLQAAGPPSTG
jgi:hypothetical protein